MTVDFLENNRKFFLEQIRPAWVEVDLGALEYNTKSIKSHIGQATKLMAVIKANAYSHGALEVAQTFVDNGADYLGVATMTEALQLRGNDIDAPILILGFTPENQLGRTIDMEVAQTIYNLDQAKRLSEEGKLRNRDGIVHIKIDTGMGRLGFLPNKETLNTIKYIGKLPNIKIEGIFTHFADSDSEDMGFTDEQFEIFMDFIGQLEDMGIEIPIKHISNSAGLIDRPEYNLDMVRVGIGLFGIYPAGPTHRERLDIKPALEIKAKISSLKTLPKSTSIGYNRTFTTERETKVATLPIGYADGFNQEMSDRLGVWAGGERVKVLGRVCMDQMMVDVTDIFPVDLEDEVSLISHRDRDILNTHFITNLSLRLPRVYIKDGHILKMKDYMMD